MRRAAASAGVGFVVVGVVVGGGLALAHVVLNRVASPFDAALVLGAFVLLYGALGAVVFGTVTGALVMLPPTRRLGAGAGAVRAGTAAFTFVFLWLYWNHGLTYDELPRGWPDGPAGMLGFVALTTLVIGAAALVVGDLLAGAFVDATGRLRARRAVGLAGGLLVLHLALPSLLARPRRFAPPPPSPAVTRAPDDPGLSVVLLGIDGADWRAITPLLDAGRLPNFAALVADGASGPLATLPDANSAVIWASIYTGRTPAIHGVQDFFRVRLPGMRGPGLFPVHRTWFSELAGVLESRGLAEREIVDRRALDAVPLWEVVSALGLSVGVVDGWEFTFPAPRRLAGGGWFVAYGADAELRRQRERGVAVDRAGFAPYVTPADVLDDVAPVLGEEDLAWQSAATLRLLARRGRPRFLAIYTHEPDSVQHLAWRGFEPDRYLRVSAADRAALADRVPATYAAIDTFIGALRARADPRTVLVVVSDHGNAPTMLHAMDTQHRHGPPGVVFMVGGPVEPGVHLAGAHVLDVFPTVLYLLGLAVPQDGDGRVLADALDPGFLTAHPIRVVDSYDGLAGAAFAEPGSPGEGALERNDRNHDAIERLRALGYVR